jgi:ABC-type sugar transport system substrate-binding protein
VLRCINVHFKEKVYEEQSACAHARNRPRRCWLGFCGGSKEAAAPSGQLRLVLLVKSLGNGFFEAVADGGQEAAKELGNVTSIYQGPAASTAEGQIEIIESLIAQR